MVFSNVIVDVSNISFRLVRFEPLFCHCKVGRLVGKIGVYVVSFVENVKKLKRKNS